jgi:hypothetical protein
MNTMRLMAFNLKRQKVSPEIVQIVARNWKQKDLDAYRLSKKNQKELADVLEEIEKWTIPRYLVLKKLKKKLGKGIFLHPKAQPILRGQLIAPYAGEVSIVVQNQVDDACYAFDPVTDLHLTKEEQKRFDPKNRYHPRRLYSLKLDAEKRGNFTRFINHSSQPNVIAYLVSTQKHPYEIIYFAKKKIRPGEQLLVSYEDEEKSYWGALGIKPFPMTPRTFRIK